MYPINKPYASILFLLVLLVLSLPSLPSAKEKRTKKPIQLFTTSADCLACHNSLTDSTGADLSIGTDWRSTMMANSARDPYWQAAVRRETLDHPKATAAIQEECSVCHMPMARYTAHTRGMTNPVFFHLYDDVQSDLTPLAQDGVSCTLCHQITKHNLGKPESYVGRFTIDTQDPMGNRSVYGPYQVDPGRTHLMKSASRFEQKKADHIRESGLCASCHTLYTHALGPDGQSIGKLPEQVPYLEWLHSSYPEKRACQSCHMQNVGDKVLISSVWGQPREGFKKHIFRGGNFFMPLLLNRHRDMLRVIAKPQELQATSNSAATNLKTRTAQLDLTDIQMQKDQLEITVSIKNLAGHKLPSAYPSRRCWIHLKVSDEDNKPIFESGKLLINGMIQGNDNDHDATKVEPHYKLIKSPDQVQIYEPILAGKDGKVTTGLLTATQYLKDNRLLPEGFNKSTAPSDVAVKGKAEDDTDFSSGGDRIVYQIQLKNQKGPYKIETELLYQPIGYRWAHNLDAYQAKEPQRFVGIYQQAAKDSAIIIAKNKKQYVPIEPVSEPIENKDETEKTEKDEKQGNKPQKTP